MTQQIDLSSLSAADLRKALEAKEQAERKAEQDKRRQYEQDRDDLIMFLGEGAKTLAVSMQAFKNIAFTQLSAFREQMLAYGDIRGGKDNKGSFEIKNDHFKIVFRTHVIKAFDERAELGASKLREFLKGFVKKRDREVYTLVESLLDRNSNDEYDINLINRLYKLEDRFDDDNWREAIKLFKEAYNPKKTAQYIQFYTLNDQGGWDNVVLDFAKLAVTPTELNTEQA